MILRTATIDDVGAIAHVWHSGWADGHLGHVPAGLEQHRQLADFLARVPEHLDATTVATHGSRVAGFVMVHDDEIEQLYVAADARGAGVADHLLQHGASQIAERYDVAWLAVVAGNTRARRFYERNGWTDAGAFEYDARTAHGKFVVPSHRYEKDLIA
jgi:ribosomal protein S18 acetylase RimI-like enzyme